jgi:hypothetical protein
MEISNWYDRTHPHAKIERIAGFRGDEEDEPQRVKDSRKFLNKTRKQMRTAELSDNDDVYGVSDDDEALEPPAKSRATLRVVPRKG